MAINIYDFLYVKFDQNDPMELFKKKGQSAQYRKGSDFEVIDGLCFAISARVIHWIQSHKLLSVDTVNIITQGAIKLFIKDLSTNTLAASLQAAYFESYFNEEGLKDDKKGLSSNEHMQLSAEYLNSNYHVHAYPGTVRKDKYPARLAALFFHETTQLSASPYITMLQHGTDNGTAGHAVVFGRIDAQHFFLFDPNDGLFIIPMKDLRNFIATYFSSYGAPWYCLIRCQ